MRKFLIIVLNFILVTGLYGDAFKLMSGLNLSRYTVSPEEENAELTNKMGLWVGGGFEFDLSEKKIFLEFDLLLLQKGSKVKFLAQPDLKSNYSLKTLSIPALIGIKFRRNLPVYIFGGTEFSVILSHAFVKKSGEKVDEQDLKEKTKDFDFGLVFGCGFEVAFSKFQSFFVEGRYHHGFMNIINGFDHYDSIKTRAVLFVLGIKSY